MSGERKLERAADELAAALRDRKPRRELDKRARNLVRSVRSYLEDLTIGAGTREKPYRRAPGDDREGPPEV